MDEAKITNTIQEIQEIEMFALLGQKDCEIFLKDKTIARLQMQFEKLRATLAELEEIKKKNTELETSQKSLAEHNISLDRALTEERQKNKTLQEEVQKLNSGIGVLKNVQHDKSKKRTKSKPTDA